MGLASEENKYCINQQLFDILHPCRYDSNFSDLNEFEEYLLNEKDNRRLLLIPTLRRVLSAYESWEGYEQCIILKKVIEIVIEKRKK